MQRAAPARRFRLAHVSLSPQASRCILSTAGRLREQAPLPHRGRGFYGAGGQMERIEISGISVETVIAGTGPPLLFLHGGDYVAQNRAFLDRLAQRFRVVAPRHPGFGTTPRPAWFRTIHDIAYLYLDLLDRLDLRDVTLAGSSFGGWVALEIAVRSTARLGRLVLIDSLRLKF